MTFTEKLILRFLVAQYFLGSLRHICKLFCLSIEIKILKKLSFLLQMFLYIKYMNDSEKIMKIHKQAHEN